MQILHLSDLHLTDEHTSFDDVWTAVRPALGSHSFDFIIVSGDLSQRATVREYAALLRFTRTKLLPLLRRRERHRIVFVPGNHDVDWNAEIGSVRSIGALLADPNAFRKQFQLAQQRPGVAALRYRVDPYGHATFMEIDARKYAARFANVQSFFSRYYGSGALPPRIRYRPFDLSSRDERQHWSAHVFVDERVAFFGFNSCHRNDPFWTGAQFSATAVETASQYARQLGPEFQKIAVWHHGFVADKGRPDYLSIQDLARLHNAGFRIGLHGHTHSAAFDVVDQVFSDRFIVVSTGSLGAHSTERPDAVGNQFSVVHLWPNQVDVEVYEKGSTGEYRNHEARRRSQMLRIEPRDEPPLARLQRRTWRVRRDGIADVSVRYEDLRTHGSFSLALVTPPFCEVQGDPAARTDRGERPVSRHELPDRRVRFSLVTQDERFRHCEWGYRISNAIALARSDLKCKRARDLWLPEVGPHEDGRSHTVRVRSERLEMALEFAEPARDVVSSVRVLVERRVERDGVDQWETLESAARLCEAEIKGNAVTLTVHAPVLGYRYTPVVKLRKPGPVVRPSDARVAHAVLDRCRAEVAGESRLGRQLRETFERGFEMAQVFGQPFAGDTTWLALIWNEQRLRLLPAFGRFTNPSWSARFAAGAGVAGHAYRFGAPAAWHRDAASPTSVIYQPKTEHNGPYQRDYKWIACFPIAYPTRGPLGVVSFAGVADQSGPDRRLAAFARALTLGKLTSQDKTFCGRLAGVINVAFWHAVSTDRDADASARALANRAVRVLRNR